MRQIPLRRVLLVGFMGSGKTAVGRDLADRLGWRFVDFDQAIESAEGMSVGAMFEALGEGHFRAVEERVAKELLSLESVVLSSGGGWAAKAGRLDEVPQGTETFWLKVTAEEAIRRTAAEPGRRPLLAGPESTEVAERLLRARASEYRRADWALDTMGVSVEDVSARILELLGRKYPETRIE